MPDEYAGEGASLAVQVDGFATQADDLAVEPAGHNQLRKMRHASRIFWRLAAQQKPTVTQANSTVSQANPAV